MVGTLFIYLFVCNLLQEFWWLQAMFLVHLLSVCTFVFPCSAPHVLPNFNSPCLIHCPSVLLVNCSKSSGYGCELGQENICNPRYFIHSIAPILTKITFVPRRRMKVSCTYFWRIRHRNVGHKNKKMITETWMLYSFHCTKLKVTFVKHSWMKHSCAEFCVNQV